MAKRHRKDGSGYALLLAVPAPVLSLVRHPPYRVVPVCSIPTCDEQSLEYSFGVIGDFKMYSGNDTCCTCVTAVTLKATQTEDAAKPRLRTSEALSLDVRLSAAKPKAEG